ncbi:SPFH domain-containing protein [Microbispora sp. H11081]|uniref:SPFH domain-containing protein n=1 Tax=Microbispora sp. H11081 TaxID=2729107 RepID=UPI0014761B82|nr:SPFH domain-containing protein [Microbispora sp. H11081]
MTPADHGSQPPPLGAWAATAGAPPVVPAVAVLRVVKEGDRLVVFPSGRRTKVKEPGVAAALPGAGRVVRVPPGPAFLDLLWLDAVTADGVAVTLNGTALASVPDPAAYASDPGVSESATLRATEAEIRAHVAERDLVEVAQPTGESLRDLSERVSRRTREWGVEVTVVDLHRVERRRKADLARWAKGHSARAEEACTRC